MIINLEKLISAIPKSRTIHTPTSNYFTIYNNTPFSKLPNQKT